MRRGKSKKHGHHRRGGIGNISIVLALALILVIGSMVGSTLAWLFDKTDTITNTFTDSNIDITLTEEAGKTEYKFKMIPGYSITKDPKVIVSNDSEDCWLFVEIKEDKGTLSAYSEGNSNFKDYLEYEVADGWEKLEDDNTSDSDVYFRKVLSTDSPREFPVLKGDIVKVSENITKEIMASIDGKNADDTPNGNEKQPTLTFQAYAIQLYKSNDGENNTKVEFDVSEAWGKAKPVNTTQAAP